MGGWEKRHTCNLPFEEGRGPALAHDERGAQQPNEGPENDQARPVLHEADEEEGEATEDEELWVGGWVGGWVTRPVQEKGGAGFAQGGG